MTGAPPKPQRRGPKPRRPIRRRYVLGAKRRAAKAAGWIDLDAWEEVQRFYGWRCAFNCGRAAAQMGHAVAIAHGGEHNISNVFPICLPCNAWQGTRTMYPPRRHRWMPKEEA